MTNTLQINKKKIIINRIIVKSFIQCAYSLCRFVSFLSCVPYKSKVNKKKISYLNKKKFKKKWKIPMANALMIFW